MYSRIKKSDNEETILKAVGPFRFNSSGSSSAPALSSGISVPVGTITIPISPDYPAVPIPSKQEDFDMLIETHRRTLELLSR
jgi:hypothetical protein